MISLHKKLSSVREASRLLPNLSNEKVKKVLLEVADEILKNSENLLGENKKDLAKMSDSDPKYDRLKLTKERIEGIAGDMKNVAALENPLNRVLEEKTLENGLELNKISVPLGVIGIIYEARPNVTFDVFSLCFKSGNACVLKGGSDAYNSNLAGVKIIQDVLEKNGIPKSAVLLMSADRSEVEEMLQADKYINVVIPRGSEKLINFVRENAKIPVIETGAGICHTYVDKNADINMAKKIVENAKTRRVSVCNALDTLIIHSDKLDNLAEIVEPLKKHGVEIYADKRTYKILENSYNNELLFKAEPEDFGKEWLSLKMSVKTADTKEDAVNHISIYSSGHSEAIVTEDKDAADYFLRNVDAACVYLNASTAFTDGAQFGLGAEIGISTQKLHARGPMSIRELTSYKWVIKGSGQTRPR